jgi:hypothetical protein
MESSLGNLRLRWNLLRVIAAAIAIATFTLTLTTIPIAIWTLWVLALLIGISVSALALVKCDVTWSRITLLAQSILFAIALLTAISTGGPAEEVPLLLLAFVMILGTEQVLSLTSNYGAQFSLSKSAPVAGFNVGTLQRSLDRLYRSLAWDGVIFSAAYLLSLTVASMGSLLSPVAPVLSDISVYVLVTSISLAILIVSREE